MRRMMALVTVVVLLCCGCGDDFDPGCEFNRWVSGGVEIPGDIARWEGESRELQRRLVRWYGWNLKSHRPEPGFRDAYSTILAGEGGIMGWISFPDSGTVLPLLHQGCEGQGFVHRKSSPFPTGDGGTAVLELSDEVDCRYDLWRTLGEGTVFQIHILDQMLTYRIVGLPPEEDAEADRCLLVLVRDHVDVMLLAVREEGTP